MNVLEPSVQAEQGFDGLSRHQQRGRYLPALHRIQRSIHGEVHCVDLHTQCIEHLAPQHVFGAALLAQTDRLPLKIRNSSTLRPSEEMELLGMKGGDVDELVADVPERPCVAK